MTHIAGHDAAGALRGLSWPARNAACGAAPDSRCLARRASFDFFLLALRVLLFLGSRGRRAGEQSGQCCDEQAFHHMRASPEEASTWCIRARSVRGELQ
jgi:hypothetical protein